MCRFHGIFQKKGFSQLRLGLSHTKCCSALFSVIYFTFSLLNTDFEEGTSFALGTNHKSLDPSFFKEVNLICIHFSKIPGLIHF